MSELAGIDKVKRVQLEAVVIRADGTQIPLGVIADSKWRCWSPRRFLSDRRIRKANAARGERS